MTGYRPSCAHCSEASRQYRLTSLKAVSTIWEVRSHRREKLIDRQQRVQIVCARFPFGTGEDFIEAEVRALEARGVLIELNPARRRGRRRQGTEDLLVAPRARSALLSVVPYAVRHRSGLAVVIKELLRDRRHVVKNLAVLVPGLVTGLRATERRVDHIHAHWLSTSATMAWIASRMSGIPFSVTAHRWDIGDANLLSVKMRDALFIRAISMDGLARLSSEARYGGRAVLIHMGVDVPKNQPSRRRRCGEPLRLISPANLVPVKGHRYLMEALASCRGVATLDLAGDGSERSALERDVTNLGIADLVRFLGQVPHAELLRMYADGLYDAVVLPSLDLGDGEHEGIPVALMEAMASGLPVVSTTTGGIAELVQDRVSGLLVPPASAADLGQAIRELAADVALLEATGNLGRQRVAEHFSAAQAAEALMSEIYR